MATNGTPASTSRSSVRIPGRFAPAAKAASEASWIVGPSITGSENGMPTSMASAPASANARTTSVQSSPRPPVTYGTSSLRPVSRTDRRCAASAVTSVTEDLRHLGDVLVAATGEVEDHDLPRQVAARAEDPGERVGRLERRDDPLSASQDPERVQHLGVVDLLVGGPPGGGEMGVLWADPGIVEAGRDRLRLHHLPVLVLQQVRLRAVHDARHAVRHRRATGWLDAYQRHVRQ